MHDVVLTVPHGHPDEDRAGEPVATTIHRLLVEDGLDVALIVNRLTRKGKDGNRPESRDRKFRKAIEEELEDGARLMIDVHSFRPKSRRFHGKDIVLLHTPGVQSQRFLRSYAQHLRDAGAELHRSDVRVEVEPAKYVDDVCIQARELGVSRDALMLAEHNDLDHPQLAGEVYGVMHAEAIRRLFREAQRERKARGGRH